MKLTFTLLLIIIFSFLKLNIATAQINHQDSLALVDLYNNTNGLNWTNNTNWLTNSPVKDWFGVTVKNSRVSELNLNENNLNGDIPISLGNLDSLVKLNLYKNYLIDTIPSALGNLSNLTHLELIWNNLSGSIPSSLGNLSKLTDLDLSINQLTGEIPSSLGNLSRLINLSLYVNQLSGNIPESLGNLTNLQYLLLPFNQLIGSIPASIGNLRDLDRFDMNDNRLSGAIPSSFKNFIGSLTLLDFVDNEFTFSGFEDIAGKVSIECWDQANIPLHYQDNILSVSAGGTLANDTFHWYKDSFLIASIVGDSTYFVSSSGRYSVSVTNSIVTRPTGLTLYSDTVDISILAVNFLNFNASVLSKSILLNWQTNNETNNDYFEIERTNSKNFSNWSGLGKVKGKISSSKVQPYSFEDIHPLQGQNFYRLKQVDKDGKFTYSNIVSVAFENGNAILIYPNPVKNVLNIEGLKASAINELSIVNANGKIIAIVSTKDAHYSWNVQSLAKGIYYLHIEGNGVSKTLKFTKE